MAAPQPPRRVVLLINPTSGRGRGGRNAPLAADRLRARGVHVVEVCGQSADESFELARQALDEGADALVACGGDGTVHLALQLVAGTETPLGIIPVGTGDDNARTLGLPLADAEAAADIVASGHVRTVDAGRISAADGVQRWFLGVMSSGFDSAVNERANTISWPKGQARYLVSILGELRVFKPLPYTVVIDDVHHDGKAMLVAVGNGVSYGGGMKVCPSAIVDDGELSVLFLAELGKPTFLRVLPKVFSGTHVTHPAVTEYSGRRIHLDAPDQIVYADGERVGPLPADIEVAPGAVRVIVPAQG